MAVFVALGARGTPMMFLDHDLTGLPVATPASSSSQASRHLVDMKLCSSTGVAAMLTAVSVAHSFRRRTRSRHRMIVSTAAAAKDVFTLPDGREVKVLSNQADLASELCFETARIAGAAIAEKGAFSLCVPGGFGPADGQVSFGAALIADALALLAGRKDVDFSKWHVFFAGERLDCQESYALAKKSWLGGCGIPSDQVHPIAGGMPAEAAAAQYTAEICMQPETVLIDSPEGLPALDLLLLDVGSDGAIARLKPNSPELKEIGSGKVVLPIETPGAEAAAVSLDFMNAARRAVLVAAGHVTTAAVVAAALKDASPESPASLVRSAKTLWLLDTESAAMLNW